MRVSLSERWSLGLDLIARSAIHVTPELRTVNGMPCCVVDRQKTPCWTGLMERLRAEGAVPVALFLEAVRGAILLPWDWLEPIECFATHLPNEMPEGFAAEPLGESDALREEGFEYVVRVALTQELWEEVSGEFEPTLSLAELLDVLGFRGVLLPPNCPL